MRSGESARLPAMSPGFNPARWVGLLLTGFSPCSEGFSPVSMDFLLPRKPTSQNSNLTRIENTYVNQLRMMKLPNLC